MITETSVANKHRWIVVWKLHVVPKVRVIWWRVLQGILPDSVTLKYRHIKLIGLCDVWQAMDKDLMNALIVALTQKVFGWQREAGLICVCRDCI